MADNPYQQSNLGGAPVQPAAPGYAPSQLPGVVPSVGTPGVVPAIPKPAPTTVYKQSPLDYTSQVESGNRNTPQQIHDINTERGHPAQGYWQIIDPTWRIYAPRAGIDISKYPSAINAPRDIQAKVAALIPINQFGPRTQQMLKAKYPGINVNAPLGVYGGTGESGNVATAPGTTVNTSGAAKPSPDWGLAFASLGQSQDGKPSTLDRAQSAFGGGGQQEQPPPQNLQGEQAAAVGNVRQMQIAQQAQALAAALAQQRPLTWGSAPFGSAAGQQTPGTTLNSMGA